jgi:hypothetical protein
MKPLSFTSNPTDNGGSESRRGKSARNTPRLAAAGLTVIRGPVTDPWGLAEMPVENPDGTRIVPGEPPGHTLRRDPRPS